jgi:hypothetical protein
MTGVMNLRDPEYVCASPPKASSGAPPSACHFSQPTLTPAAPRGDALQELARGLRGAVPAQNL